MSIAFNGHNMIKQAINEPTPEEATFAIYEAREIIRTIWDNEYGQQYPLFPDVAKYVAAIYHHNGLIMFHPILSHYQKILTDLDYSKDLKNIRDKIVNIYSKYQNNPQKTLNDILIGVSKTSQEDDYVNSNVIRLIAIDIYTNEMNKYTDSLIEKIKK